MPAPAALAASSGVVGLVMLAVYAVVLKFLNVPEADTALTAAQLGPSADRTYKALEFFAEGNYDNFFWQASYTWSKSRGNTEGGDPVGG